MSEKTSWDSKEKAIANIDDWGKKFAGVRELVVSDDGEKIAAVVQLEKGKFATCVNGETGKETFERICSLKFNPNNQLISLVLKNYEWAVAVDHTPDDKKFDYIWNLTVSSDGKNIAANVKKEETCGVVINGKAWENRFPVAADVAVSPDGKKSATHVQLVRLAALDNAGFLKKCWTVAVDGTPWNKNFLNLWGAVFSGDSNHVAAAVRTDMAAYTIAVDGNAWEQTFPNVWAPVFKPGTADAVAPVQTPKGWTLAMNGKPMWGGFSQLWNQVFTVDGKRLAAVVAAGLGKWTVAVDGSPWKAAFNQAVLSPVFSSDGKRVAAAAKDSNRWTIAVDGVAWAEKFDNVWDPVFSPQGDAVAGKVEKDGKFYLAIDGKVGKKGYASLWNPVFSPDGKKLLVRCVDNGKYYRKVMSINEI